MHALRLIDDWPVPHAAAVVIGREGILDQAGAVDRGGRFASVTKLFTAYVTLMACQDGDLDLATPAGPPGSTVRHLLAHSSGLPFEGATPLAPPERRRVYSNAGFDLLGTVLSSHTGYPFFEYLALQLLEPLAIDARLVGRPSDGLFGTTRGMAVFARELVNPTLLDPSWYQQAVSVAYPGLGGVLPGIGRFDPLDWGLGFEIRNGKSPHWTGLRNSPGTFGHFGGSGAFLWVDPEAHLAVCCLTGREFDDWALHWWPAFADAVLEEFSSA
ncbi:MAG: serine hydrolase domain-containing protein [Actinomycetota bacterium]